MNTLINGAACVAIAATVLTIAHALRGMWRRKGDELMALADATREFRPCPDCQPGDHPPARCTCPADCGHANCVGTVTSFFDLAAWERTYNEQQAGRP